MLIWAWKALAAALLPSAAGPVLAGVSDFEPLVELLASAAAFRPSTVSLARVVMSFWTVAEEPLLFESASVASLSLSESVAVEPVAAVAWAAVGCCTPAIAAARDCEMKAREDGEVTSESLAFAVFALPFAGAMAPVGSVGVAVDAAAVAAAAFCAASACDWASASRKVGGALFPCAFAPPCALAAVLAAAPAAAALVVPGCDCDVLCFEPELEPGFALEGAAPDPGSLPEAVAVELSESLEEWAEVPDSLTPLASRLAPVVWLVRWPEPVPGVESARWLEPLERAPEPEPTLDVERGPELEPDAELEPDRELEPLPAPELAVVPESNPLPELAPAPSLPARPPLEPNPALEPSAALKPGPELEARLAAALEAPAEAALAAFDGAGMTGIDRRESRATDQSSLRPDTLGAFVGFMLLAPLECVALFALPALHGRANGFRALGRVLPVLALCVSLDPNAGDHLLLLLQRFVEPCEKGLEIAGCGAVDARFGAG